MRTERQAMRCRGGGAVLVSALLTAEQTGPSPPARCLGSLSTPTRACGQSLRGFSDHDVEQDANQVNGLARLTLFLLCSRFLLPSQAGEHRHGRRRLKKGEARRAPIETSSREDGDKQLRTKSPIRATLCKSAPGEEGAAGESAAG